MAATDHETHDRAESTEAGETATDLGTRPANADVPGAAELETLAEPAGETAAELETPAADAAEQAVPADESASTTTSDPETGTETEASTADAVEAEAHLETRATDPDERTEEPATADPFAIPVDPLALIFQAPDLSAVPAAPTTHRTPDEESDDATDDSADSDNGDDRGEDEDGEDSGNRSPGSRSSRRRRRSRGRSGRGSADRGTDETGDSAEQDNEEQGSEEANGDGADSRRRRRRRRGEVDMELEGGEGDDPENTVTRVRAPRQSSTTGPQGVTGLKGSTRLEAKRQRRRDSRTGGRQRRHVITEAEFLARRESVDRRMLVRQREQRMQIAVMEDGVLAEHFVSNTTQDSMIGNVYLGKVQNVLPSMEAAFVDIGRGRNAVLYAGEVNWDAANLEGKARKIENALKSGDSVLVQVTKDPVGHKGARLTSQVSLPGRYLVYVPGGSMTGISRKLPDVERSRLKKILKDHLPENAGVIVRTAAEGTSEQELMNDINRLRAQWEGIEEKSRSTRVLAPELLYSEPDLTIKVVRDVFNEDFSGMIVQGPEVWDNIEAYVTYVAPHLLDRLQQWKPEEHDDEDLFSSNRIDEQLHKALERKVFLPSGGSLVIDRTEAMTVVDVNTGKFTGSGGNLEETVTKNNLEAAEEIVRQLRLRDIGGIIVIDFIDMVLESNRDLVLRRLVECLGRDRTKHQVAEVTSLGLVQMTRKRMGTGLVEIFSETCEHCNGRGIVLHDMPVEHRRAHTSHGEPRSGGADAIDGGARKSTRSERRRRSRERQAERESEAQPEASAEKELSPEETAERKARADAARAAFATIAAASQHGHENGHGDAAATAMHGTSAEHSANRQAKPDGGAADAAQVGEGAAESGAPDAAKAETGTAAAHDGGASRTDDQSSAAESSTTGETAPSSRSSRRRKSRRAGSDQGRPGAQQDTDAGQGASGSDAAPTLTIGGERVEVPRGRRNWRQDEAQKDLSALENALDQRAPRDAVDQAPESAAEPAPASVEPAPTPVEPAPTPVRRRRRAASSDGTSGEIRTIDVSAESSEPSGGHRFSASAAVTSASATSASSASTGDAAGNRSQDTEGADNDASPSETPLIIGVGVRAEDIARTE